MEPGTQKFYTDEQGRRVGYIICKRTGGYLAYNEVAKKGQDGFIYESEARAWLLKVQGR